MAFLLSFIPDREHIIHEFTTDDNRPVLFHKSSIAAAFMLNMDIRITYRQPYPKCCSQEHWSLIPEHRQ